VLTLNCQCLGMYLTWMMEMEEIVESYTMD
jgi:hypothetical protein